MTKQWEIGAGRITTNFLMAVVDSTHFTERWAEFFPEAKIEGFVYTKKGLYASIWNKQSIEDAIKTISDNPDSFFENLIKMFDKETEDLWENLENFKKQIPNLQPDNEKLIQLHKKYLHLFGNYAIYTPIVRFSETFLRSALNSQGIDEEKIGCAINPPYRGAQFHLNEELKLIAKDINQSEFKQEIKSKIFENHLSEEDYLVYKRLRKIKEKYGWVKSYINFYKDVEIKDLLADLMILLDKEDSLKEEKKPILLDEKTNQLIKWLNFTIDMKNKIQNIQAYIFYLGNKIYSLISQQIEIPLEKIEWLTENEIVSFLNGFKYEEEIVDLLINDRKEGILIEPRTGTLIQDKELIKKIFLHQAIDLDKVFYGEKEEVKGIFINTKEVKGTAFLALSHDDLMKREILPGNILITRAVTPEYTPYLNKFQAIVADEGGIASHGSIVAREMGISMIIGTRNATKFVKEGDQILLKEDGSIEKINLGGKQNGF